MRLVCVLWILPALALVGPGCTTSPRLGAFVQGAEPMRWTPAGISTPAYESSAVFSPEGRDMYFMRADQGFDHYRILHSRCGPNGWSEPVEPSFSSAAGIDDADPFVTDDGSRLLFVSTRHRHGEIGNEDFDIFVVDRDTDGDWGEARRLPEPVNSRHSELLPRMDRDGVLYFGSSRPGGRGGADIHAAVQSVTGEWMVTRVTDVNTTAEEYEADISGDGQQLAVVSDRDGKSRVHLYERQAGRWIPTGRVKAREDVFQVGPRWSPDGRQLMFSQDAGVDSGEIFLVQTAPNPDLRWPPACGGGNPAGPADDPTAPAERP